MLNKNSVNIEKVFTSIKTWFLFWVTLAVSVVICLISAVSVYNYTSDSYRANYKNLFHSLQTFSEYRGQRRALEVDKVKNELLEIFGDMAKYCGVYGVFSDDLNEMVSILSQWSDRYDVIRDYVLTSDGFVVKGQKDRYFTDDLSIFFNDQNLIYRTFELSSKISFYNNMFQLTNKGEAVFFSKLVSYYDFFVKLLENREGLLNFFGHQQKTNYGFFYQDYDDNKPTGGRLDSYLILSLYKGRVQVENTNYLNLSENTPSVEKPLANNYSTQEEGRNYYLKDLQTLNYSSCLDTAANEIIDYFETEEDLKIEGIFVIGDSFLKLINHSQKVGERVDLQQVFDRIFTNFDGGEEFFSYLYFYWSRDVLFYTKDESFKVFDFNRGLCADKSESGFVTNVVYSLDGQGGHSSDLSITKKGNKFLIKQKIYSSSSSAEQKSVFVGFRYPKGWLNNAKILNDSSGKYVEFDQADGSVTSGYIFKNNSSPIEVEYIFDQPDQSIFDTQKSFIFFGQTGLEQTNISLDDEVYLYNSKTETKQISNKYLIQSGLRIFY